MCVTYFTTIPCEYYSEYYDYLVIVNHASPCLPPNTIHFPILFSFSFRSDWVDNTDNFCHLLVSDEEHEDDEVLLNAFMSPPCKFYNMVLIVINLII